MNRDFDTGTLVLAGASALRAIRAQRRRAGFLPWEALNKIEQRRALAACAPRARDIDWPALAALGAWDEDVDDALNVLVGRAAKRRRGLGVSCRVRTALPEHALMRANQWLVVESPQYLVCDLAGELPLPVVFGTMLELCNNISISDRCGGMPPFSLPSERCSYLNANPACAPGDIKRMVVSFGSYTKEAGLARYARHLFSNADSPMECIVGAQCVLPFSLGGFDCGDALFNYRIDFNERARAIAGMPYAIADCYFPKAREVFEYNGHYHDAPASRVHDERRNAALESMGIKVVAFNSDTIRDMDAMEAIAWDLHKRAGGRYQNHVSNRLQKQINLANGLRAAFGLQSI